MDIIDEKIIDVLKENSRATASQISKTVNLSIPAVSDRIKRLEESNIIEKYTIKLNREKLGYKLMAFVFINIDSPPNIHGFRELVIEFSEVIECHHMAGEYDYMIKVLVSDTTELEDFLSNKLKSIKGVQKSNTLIALSTLKEKNNR